MTQYHVVHVLANLCLSIINRDFCDPTHNSDVHSHTEPRRDSLVNSFAKKHTHVQRLSNRDFQAFEIFEEV